MLTRPDPIATWWHWDISPTGARKIGAIGFCRKRRWPDSPSGMLNHFSPCRTQGAREQHGNAAAGPPIPDPDVQTPPCELRILPSVWTGPEQRFRRQALSANIVVQVCSLIESGGCRNRGSFAEKIRSPCLPAASD